MLQSVGHDFFVWVEPHLLLTLSGFFFLAAGSRHAPEAPKEKNPKGNRSREDPCGSWSWPLSAVGAGHDGSNHRTTKTTGDWPLSACHAGHRLLCGLTCGSTSFPFPHDRNDGHEILESHACFHLSLRAPKAPGMRCLVSLCHAVMDPVCRLALLSAHGLDTGSGKGKAHGEVT